jgi:hypothetical protein
MKRYAKAAGLCEVEIQELVNEATMNHLKLKIWRRTAKVQRDEAACKQACEAAAGVNRDEDHVNNIGGNIDTVRIETNDGGTSEDIQPEGTNGRTTETVQVEVSKGGSSDAVQDEANKAGTLDPPQDEANKAGTSDTPQEEGNKGGTACCSDTNLMRQSMF